MTASRLGTGLTAALAVWCVANPFASGAQRPFMAVPAADARNVQIEHGGDGRVTLLYDLVSSDPRATFTVTLEAAATPVETFDIRPLTTQGDIGDGVSPGTGKRVVWDAGQDVEDVQLEQFVFRLVASPARDATPERLQGHGTLTVISSPDGAQIAIDGRNIGVAPLAIQNVPLGRHRLTATLSGFAESTREVETTDDGASQIVVPLSPSGTQTQSAAARRGSGLKWIAIGGGGAAAAGIALAAGGGTSTGAPPAATTTTTPTTTTTTPTTTTTTTNRAPTVTCGNIVFGGTRAMVPTDVAITSATRLQFVIAAASDVDGDALSYTMTYGNGVTATGTYSAVNNSTTYIYPGASVYSPSVTVRDARGGEGGCRFATVTTSTVAGEWTGPPTAGKISSRFTLSHSGLNVTGNYFEGERTTASTLQGTLSSNVAGRKDGTMSLTVGGNYGNLLTFQLEPSDDLRTYRGTYTYRGTTAAFEMRK